MSDSNLERVLRPRTVAVIGASADPSKRGHQALRALLDAPFDGKVLATNPDRREILGIAVQPSVLDLPETPDLVYIATPAATVPRILEQCATRNVGGAIVAAVGFRESGEDGAALEREISVVAARSGVRVVGPNTSGLLNTSLRLNLVGMRNVPAGDLALLSQSGNIALDIVNGAGRWGTGLSIYVGIGNETDIAFHEYLEYLEGHAETRAVMMYVEGFRDGRGFVRVASRLSRVKPLIVLKGGRSESGVAAARSHTGAIAGSYPVLRALLKQHGVTEVQRSDELLFVASSLAHQHPISAGLGVAILSDGGGHGTLTADALNDQGVRLATLQPETKTRLRTLLGSPANVGNPVDVAGAADRDPMVFAKAIEIIAADPSVGGVMFVGLFGGYAIRFAESLADSELQAAELISQIMKGAAKPLVLHSLYANHHAPPLKRLVAGGFTVVESLEIGCRCMAALFARGLYLARPPEPASEPKPQRAQPVSIVEARREQRSTLMETEVRELLAEFDVPLAPGTLCQSPDDAAAAMRHAGAAAAFKVVSPVIPHKTDAGGVILDVRDPDAAREAFARIMANADRYIAQRGLASDIRGILVLPMLDAPIAEMIVGVRHDPDFGPVLTVGSGGTAVEVLDDFALRGLPVQRADVLGMLQELRIARLLNGFRGSPAVNREALSDVILGMAACALAYDDIDELEANPVFAYADRAVVVDARAFLTTAAVQ